MLWSVSLHVVSSASLLSDDSVDVFSHWSSTLVLLVSGPAELLDPQMDREGSDCVCSELLMSHDVQLLWKSTRGASQWLICRLAERPFYWFTGWRARCAPETAKQFGHIRLCVGTSRGVQMNRRSASIMIHYTRQNHRLSQVSVHRISHITLISCSLPRHKELKADWSIN